MEVYKFLQIEPFEVKVENIQKLTEEKDVLQRLDTGQSDEIPGQWPNYYKMLLMLIFFLQIF